MSVNAELFTWREVVGGEVLAPWRPHKLYHHEWPPNYRGVYAWRIEMLARLRRDPALLRSAISYYESHPALFIMHWMDTYDPRRKGSKWIPFIMFERQSQFIDFLTGCLNDQQSGLVEKCRDAGATWLAAGFSVHSWRYIPDFSIGWGSRKQELVDRIGDPDSIFEKIRLMINRLPDVFKPDGYDPRKHATFMRIINPQNGATITGETGDNIGRGGRKGMYFVDEAAHLERTDKIESALGDNTNVRIDISSVNGFGNMFHRRREAGIDWTPKRIIPEGYTRVFVIDWKDHPAKTQDWYDIRRAKYVREGMLHVFAQEVDRNYSAAVQNTVIDAEWIDAAIDAHLKIKWRDVTGAIHIGIPPHIMGSVWGAGLDVADGGMDRNALCTRESIIWRTADEWGERDPGVTTRRTIGLVQSRKNITVQYDVIGVGAGVKTEYNRLAYDDKIIDPERIFFMPWDASAGVKDPAYHEIPDDEESRLNKDAYANYKAQAWWSLRTRFYKTWNNIVNGYIYDWQELISLDSRMPLLQQLRKELTQAVYKTDGSMRTLIDKTPDGTKSPNLADAGNMMYFPVERTGAVMTGRYGG